MKINSILKILICDKSSKRIKFKIINQPKKWRNNDVSSIRTIFKLRNNNKYCKIKSLIRPQVIETNNVLYIHGAWENYDNSILSCSLQFFKKINRTLEKAIKMDNNLSNIHPLY